MDFQERERERVIPVAGNHSEKLSRAIAKPSPEIEHDDDTHPEIRISGMRLDNVAFQASERNRGIKPRAQFYRYVTRREARTR